MWHIPFSCKANSNISNESTTDEKRTAFFLSRAHAIIMRSLVGRVFSVKFPLTRIFHDI